MRIVLSTLLILICSISSAQNLPLEKGGGSFEHEPTVDQCLSDHDRASIQSRLEINVNRLQAEGRLIFSGDREDVKFIWPLRKATGFEWNDYYGISNFVDQDPTGGLLDYHCEERTYDGHFGTDIFTWPFPWYMYENELVEVIAGADGIIIEKDDGFEDDHCECFGSWNAVYIQHEDGSVAWYGHMKNGSLTAKGIGESVVQGEYLGVVASSGCSTGPHLHLEVYDADVHLIDPFAGDCNSLNEVSWWEIQPENRTSRINTLLTHDETPEHGCPTVNEDPHFQNDFYPGDEVLTAAYFHDAVAGTSTTYRILDSNGELWNSWTGDHGTTYAASWWYWSWYLPESGPFGEWTFEADYAGETVVHRFNYGVYAQLNENETHLIILAPNPNDGTFQINGIDNSTEINVYNTLGELVYNGVVNPSEVINLSYLSQGVYFVHLQSKGAVETLKLNINNP